MHIDLVDGDLLGAILAQQGQQRLVDGGGVAHLGVEDDARGSLQVNVQDRGRWSEDRDC